MWRRKLGGREEEDSRLSDLGQEGGTNFASYLANPQRSNKNTGILQKYIFLKLYEESKSLSNSLTFFRVKGLPPKRKRRRKMETKGSNGRK